MNYDFPLIENIRDVLPAIQGCPEFVVAEREGYTVINYNVVASDTFPPVKVSGGSKKMREERTLINALRRECRGITFCSDSGDIIARKYHKFFNLNEREETLLDNIDWSDDHVICTKQDGSMITPVMVRGKLQWHTTMGNTDVSQPVYEFVKNNPYYENFAFDCLEQGETPIFEWCSRKQRIVVDYPEDRLILTAVRNNYTGEYWPEESLRGVNIYYGVEVVDFFPQPKNIENFVDVVRGMTDDVEGFVIRFTDGHMLKIKTDQYVTIHKAKEHILYDRNIIKLILENKLDDVMAHLPREDRVRLEEFQDKVVTRVGEIVTEHVKIYNAVSKLTPKEYAINKAPSMSAKTNPIMYKLLNNSEKVVEEFTRDMVVDTIMKNLNKNSQYEQNIGKDWFDGIRYNT